jgi:G:T/U-mismatch repair DNA glycosylase
MIQDILFIKKDKEKKAIDILKKCKQDVAKKKSQVEDKQGELKKYKKWRIQEETNIYDSILNKNIKQKKIDETKHKIAKLREKDVKILEDINIAKKKLQEAEDSLLQAQESYDIAFKAVEKFKEINEIINEEELKEKNLREELETEEFYTNIGK